MWCLIYADIPQNSKIELTLKKRAKKVTKKKAVKKATLQSQSQMSIFVSIYLLAKPLHPSTNPEKSLKALLRSKVVERITPPLPPWNKLKSLKLKSCKVKEGWILRMLKDDDFVEGFWLRTEKWIDSCECWVAFATEKWGLYSFYCGVALAIYLRCF